MSEHFVKDIQVVVANLALCQPWATFHGFLAEGVLTGLSFSHRCRLSLGRQL